MSSSGKELKKTTGVHKCGGEWEFYTFDWPPKVVVCTNCTAVLRLVHIGDDGVGAYKELT